jgi:hypothetical protein
MDGGEVFKAGFNRATKTKSGSSHRKPENSYENSMPKSIISC